MTLTALTEIPMSGIFDIVDFSDYLILIFVYLDLDSVVLVADRFVGKLDQVTILVFLFFSLVCLTLYSSVVIASSTSW